VEHFEEASSETGQYMYDYQLNQGGVRGQKIIAVEIGIWSEEVRT
jgi:hypothetical protein